MTQIIIVRIKYLKMQVFVAIKLIIEASALKSNKSRELFKAENTKKRLSFL